MEKGGLKMIRRQFLKSILAGLTVLGLPRSRSVAASSLPLFNCMVAGFQYYDGPRSIGSLTPGTLLHLVREPGNIHDSKAIAVYTNERWKLGYIPRNINEIPAAHLDQGRKLHALVCRVQEDAPPWDRLEITVFLS
jgi:hypothetical protein